MIEEPSHSGAVHEGAPTDDSASPATAARESGAAYELAVNRRVSPSITNIYATGAHVRWNVYNVLLDLTLVESDSAVGVPEERTVANLNIGPSLAVSLALTLLSELARYDEEYGPIPIDQNLAARFRDTRAATRTTAYLQRLLEEEV